MEDQQQDRKFVCKWCNKRFPCGKSLGGHIRSHMIVVDSSPEKNDGVPHMKKVSSLIAESSSPQQFELSNGGSPSSYGLRENPRKTFKAVDAAIASFPLPQEKVCKQCGKGFQSLKALCGHMAFHSEKDKGLKDDHSWTSENQEDLVLDDDHSDTESEEEEDRFLWSKAKSKSCKKITIKKSSSFANTGSSSASEIDEQDHEEVAMCLMMLSKDSGNWGGVNSVVESSDNHSVILETKSSSIDTKFVRKDGLMSNFAPNEKTLQTKKLEDYTHHLEAEVFEQENSDSGYYLDEVEKIESDTSVDGYCENKRPKNEQTLAEISRRFKGDQVRDKKNMERENGRSILLSKLAKYEQRKRNNNGTYVEDSDALNESFGKVRHASVDVENMKRMQKRSKYECMNCKKTFSTYQGLGGHRPCNKKVNYYNEGWYETGENSLEDEDSDPDDNNKRKKKGIAKESSSKVDKKIISTKKNKIHECPYCNRIFKNGQALGGHKRSHFLGGGPKETRIRAASASASVSKIGQPELLDLNLPAPFEDEDDEQFVSR